ncbi:MAG: PorT family protein [Saprospiraceae bacterium]|nr:PorT family protein [Saprospiraceae bacterium]
MEKKMKFFVVALAVAFTTSAMAQLSIGPRAAVNFSNAAFDSDEEVNSGNLLGFAFGAVAEIGISDMFAIQPEVSFSQSGFVLKDEFELLGESVDLNVRYNYLQIPLLAKLKFGSGPAVVNVFAGPHVGFGLGDIDFEAELMGEKETDTQSWEDTGFSRFDFGVTGGVGVSFAAGPGKLGIDLRYQLGLNNISDEDGDDDKASNRNFQAGVSYLIPIGGK